MNLHELINVQIYDTYFAKSKQNIKDLINLDLHQCIYCINYIIIFYMVGY